MRSRQIILTIAYVAAFTGFASPPAVAQYRPVPQQTQQYHKPHKYLPGYSVTTDEVVHAPNFNNPVFAECPECEGHGRPLLTLKQIYHQRLAPRIWAPPLLSKVRQATGAHQIRLQAYGHIEFMRWTTNSPSIQPLVTSSPSGTAQEDAGVLGLGSTSTEFGGELFEDERYGGRYTGGLVFGGQERWILEAIYTSIGEDERFFQADSSTADIIARPFFNSSISEDDARLVVFPGVADGRVDISGSSSFDTFQLALRKSLGNVLGASTDYTIGYRRANLDDKLEIFDVTNSLSGPTAGARFETTDTFRTRNDFDGVDLGLIMRWRPTTRLSVDMLGKIALGRSNSVVTIDGRSITRPDGGDRTGTDGGLLTQTTNNGTFRDSSFAAMFEFGTTLRYQFHKNIQGTIGYTFLTLTDVARAADQLDDAVNTSQFGGGVLDGDPRPLFNFNDDNFVANGLRLGIQISF